MIHRLVPNVPEDLWVLSQAFPDPVRTGAGVREQLEHLLLAEETSREPSLFLRLITAAIYLDLLGLARTTAWHMIEDGRHGGALRTYLRSLTLMCFDCYATGQWKLAQELADESEAAARAGGYESDLWYFDDVESLLAAVRGNVEDAFNWAAELDRSQSRYDAQGAMKFGYHPRTLAAQAAGDWEAAYRYASALSPAGTFAPYTPHAMWVAFDLVEAATRTGRFDAARAHAASMADAGLPSISPRLALLTSGAAALVAGDSEWEGRISSSQFRPQERPSGPSTSRASNSPMGSDFGASFDPSTHAQSCTQRLINSTSWVLCRGRLVPEPN